MSSSSHGFDWSKFIAHDRPSDWQFASRDGLVLLSGRVLERPDTASTADIKFELANNGLWIEQPGLVSVATTTISQTLKSVNSGDSIFTVNLPLQDDKAVITLHPRLITPDQLDRIRRQDPLFSDTFSILLQADDFPPPVFDPTRYTTHPTASPSLTRITSPLLSPQRRAASQGSDMSVPPLSLGAARGRSKSVSRGAPAPTTAQPITGLLSAVPTSNDRPSLSSVATSAISSSAKETAEQIMAIRRAHDLLVRRMKGELEVLEARANAAGSVNGTGSGNSVVRGFMPQDGGAASTARSMSREGRTSSTSQTRGASQQQQQQGRSTSRGPVASSSSASSASMERGRSGGVKGRKRSDSATARDEEMSRRVRDQDAAEQDARGRSRSRSTTRTATDGSDAPNNRLSVPPSTSSASTSAKSKSRSPLPDQRRGTGPEKEYGTVAATEADDDDDEEDDDGGRDRDELASGDMTEEREDEGDADEDDGYEYEDVASFRPHSKTLVAIPETEELSLSAEDNTATLPSPAAPRADTRQQREEDRRESVQSPVEEEHEIRLPDIDAHSTSTEESAPFEMDEDISLPSADEDQMSPKPDGDAELEPPPVAQRQASSPAAAGTSLRPASFRPSTLSSSYAQLLAASSASGSASSRSKSTTPQAGPSHTRAHPTQPTPEEDIYQSVTNEPLPDPIIARQGAQTIRDVLALDAPSHRGQLPRRSSATDESVRIGGRWPRGAPLSPSAAADESEEDPFQARVMERVNSVSRSRRQRQQQHQQQSSSSSNSAALVGSVPIGPARDWPSSFRPPSERELERKTSVPDRERMYVPPLFHAGRTRASTSTSAQRSGRGQARGGGGTDTTPRTPSSSSFLTFEKRPLSSTAAYPNDNARRSSPSSSASLVSNTTPVAISASASASASAGRRSSVSTLSQSLRQYSLVSPPAERTPSTSTTNGVGDAQARAGAVLGSLEGEGEGGDASIAGEASGGGGREGFVPPHEWSKMSKTAEDQLSRSIGDSD